MHWRRRKEILGVGAFDGVVGIVHGKMGPPDAETVQHIICAGGGRILVQKPPFDAVAKRGVNLAVLAKDVPQRSERYHMRVLN